MFQRQGCKMCIWNNLRPLNLPDQPSQYFLMMTRRLRNPDRFERKPLCHLIPRAHNRLRSLKDARIRHQTDKGEYTRPGETHRCDTVQLSI